jgi:RND family efflux transporter MFP subunit
MNEHSAEKRMGSMGRDAGFMAACVLACVLALTVFAGCGGGEKKASVERPRVEGVTVEAVTPQDVGDAFEATGTVKTDSVSVIASRVMGTVTSLKVREGDRVKTGQLLMTIDDKDAAERARAADMAVKAAKGGRDLAESTWGRYRKLFEQKALTSQEMDQVETQRTVAEAEYARAKAMAAEAAAALEFTRITSPITGSVTEKKIDAGSMASPGMPLLTVEGGGGRYVETAADERLSGKIAVGMQAEVIIDSLGKTFPGKVREVVSSVDPGSRTFLVKVSVDDPSLESGLFARVRIPLGRRTALLVPAGAVVAKGQLTGVYAVDPRGVVTYRLVRTGSAFGSNVEVLSGLSPNERIVTAGVEKAVDGGVVAAEAKE